MLFRQGGEPDRKLDMKHQCEGLIKALIWEIIVTLSDVTKKQSFLVFNEAQEGLHFHFLYKTPRFKD